MKRYLLTLVLALAVVQGCVGFKATAGKTLATTAASVDTSMKGWAAWVALGKATPQDQLQVKENYQYYQLAMQAATNAYIVSVTIGDHTVFKEADVKLQATRSHLLSTVNTAQTVSK